MVRTPARLFRRYVLMPVPRVSCAVRPNSVSITKKCSPNSRMQALRSSEMTEPLITDRQEHCWTFTLNRPEKRNALSSELIEALIQGVDEAHAQSVALLVFQGAGKNFSAGFDFTDYESQSDGDLEIGRAHD